jgi:hypothetical protein
VNQQRHFPVLDCQLLILLDEDRSIKTHIKLPTFFFSRLGIYFCKIRVDLKITRFAFSELHLGQISLGLLNLQFVKSRSLSLLEYSVGRIFGHGLIN